MVTLIQSLWLFIPRGRRRFDIAVCTARVQRAVVAKWRAEGRYTKVPQEDLMLLAGAWASAYKAAMVLHRHDPEVSRAIADRVVGNVVTG